jgi:tRNA A-37 threonylcarbamoyl transferase component Bud32
VADPAEKDRLLAEAALKRGWLRQEQVDEAFALQKSMQDGFGLDLLLAQLLVARKFLTGAQARELLNQIAVETGEARFVGDYEALSFIGEGGMGIVYKARNRKTGDVVALKILPPEKADKEAIARFQREAHVARSLHHENIVRFIELGYDQKRGSWYCALELVEGEDLERRLCRTGVLSEDEAVAITYQVARALQHAFHNGLVHRDIKPANIMVTADGTAKLLDLGLARGAGADITQLTQSGIFVGSVFYASPEQAMGNRRLDTRSDIYSLGATLYHMLTGRPPFDGATAVAILAKHVHETLEWPADVNPDLSEGICRILAKMMAKDPRDRYQKPNELLVDLDLLVEGGPVAADEGVLKRSTVAPAVRSRGVKLPAASRERLRRTAERVDRWISEGDSPRRGTPGGRGHRQDVPSRKKRGFVFAIVGGVAATVAAAIVGIVLIAGSWSRARETREREEALVSQGVRFAEAVAQSAGRYFASGAGPSPPADFLALFADDATRREVVEAYIQAHVPGSARGLETRFTAIQRPIMSVQEYRSPTVQYVPGTQIEMTRGQITIGGNEFPVRLFRREVRSADSRLVGGVAVVLLDKVRLSEQ